MTKKHPLFILEKNDQGTSLLIVPGKLSHKNRNVIVFLVPEDFPTHSTQAIPAKMKEQFMSCLASENMRYDTFSPAQVDMAKAGKVPVGCHLIHFIPPVLGGETGPDNLILIDDRANDLFQEIWEQIFDAIKEFPQKEQPIAVQVPEPPLVITEETLHHWLSGNQQAHQKIINKNKALNPVETKINPTQLSDGSVLLTLSNHPFVNQPTILITLSPADPMARSLFESNKYLRNQIFHRDTFLLKDLNRSEACHAYRTKLFPEDTSFQIHHIHPLNWGGINNINNICFVTPEIHQRFNRMIEEPLESYLSQTDLAQKTVRIQIPVPLNAYKYIPQIPQLKIPQKGLFKIQNPFAHKKKSKKTIIKNRQSRHQTRIILSQYADNTLEYE